MATRTVTAPTTSGISLKSVLWATDLSRCSEKALHHAAEIARHFGSKLYLMHVVSSLGFTMAGSDSVIYAHDLATKDLRAIERALLVNGAVSGVPHEVVVSDGDIWEAIERISAQKKIGLIVIGTHSRTGIAKFVLGSTAEQIFRKASCPVLTVGPNCTTHVRLEGDEPSPPVLFPTDFSRESLQALPYAVALANEQKTRLILHHAISDPLQSSGAAHYSARDLTQLRSQQKLRAFERLRALTSSITLRMNPLCMVTFGEAGDAILSDAERLRAKSIVMGMKANPYASVLSHLSWSVASRVVSESTCPVLTVRA